MSDAAQSDTLIAPRPSLGDEVYDRILDDLLSLRLPPGERLSVDGLARRFGVSQTPTRAALVRLEAEGLVVKKQFTGFSVAQVPSMERFKNIFDMRCIIEPHAAERAARNGSDAMRSEIEALVYRMRDLANEDLDANFSRIVILDSAFHRAIAHSSGNDLIEETLGRLFTQLHIFRLRLHSNVARDVMNEHVEILKAILAGDGQTASRAMQRHLEAARDRIGAYVPDAP